MDPGACFRSGPVKGIRRGIPLLAIYDKNQDEARPRARCKLSNQVRAHQLHLVCVFLFTLVEVAEQRDRLLLNGQHK